MGIFGILFDWIARGKRVYVIGKGTNPYQFVSVDDLVSLCLLLANRPAKNEDFNAGSAGYGTSAGDLELLIAHSKTSARVCPITATPARIILQILDVLHMSPLVRYHYMTADKPHCVSIKKAQQLLGWEPKETNIDALKRTYDWYIAHREELAMMQGSAHRTPLKQGILALLRLFS
jgi:nucleoside-diphosphate-sugar epimerase